MSTDLVLMATFLVAFLVVALFPLAFGVMMLLALLVLVAVFSRRSVGNSQAADFEAVRV